MKLFRLLVNFSTVFMYLHAIHSRLFPEMGPAASFISQSTSTVTDKGQVENGRFCLADLAAHDSKHTFLHHCALVKIP